MEVKWCRWKLRTSLLAYLFLTLLLFVYTSSAAAQTGTFTATSNMTTPRTYHTATLLPNGKVLIAGGTDLNNRALASAELFDPEMGTFSVTGNMTFPRVGASATLLADGRVLIAGGVPDGALAVAELYDPSTGTFAATGTMVRPQAGNTSTLLNSGKVLISGTCRDSFYVDADAEGDRPELYDPVTGTFSAAGERPKNPRWCSGPVILLANGKVLVSGTAELYDPATDRFSPTGPRMTIGFYESTATLLTNGNVLVAGGTGDFGTSYNGEIYDPSKEQFTLAGNMGSARAAHTATLLRDGTILVAGGFTFSFIGDAVSGTAELYNPATATFISVGDMTSSRPHGHTATLLMDGRVLIAGGHTGSPSAELYVPPVLIPASIVTALRFDRTSVVAGSSYSVGVSGSVLTPQMFFDVRFTPPRSTESAVVENWQKGADANHDVPVGITPGTWTITGVRAHEIETDHTGDFFPVSATLTVSE